MNSSDPGFIQQIWNSLKIVIIIVTVLAPIIVVFLVLRFNRIKKGLINQHQTNQKLMDKRLEIYDQIGPKLNDILCFFSYTGNWKELTPMGILGLKRELDKALSIYTPLFSDSLSQSYNSFMHACFVSFTGWEHEEKIKSLYQLRQEHQPDWNDNWIPFFDTKNVSDGTIVRERYDKLMACFKLD